ncbi:MAG: DUF3078 domain-containing protein [Prevotellaceae bacterium]|jgi:opacity protein-like surface antigen|nr:DUF3078 domain-containing protein [Prevotellaceae bacterium]
MKKIVFMAVIALLVASNAVFAQQKATPLSETVNKLKTVQADSLAGWKFGGIISANFSQVSLTNWTAGGENTVAANLIAKASLDYQKHRWAWDNDIDLEFGMTYSETNDWRKSLDKIALASQLGYAINTQWFYAFLLDFNSQFAPGYNYTTDPNNYISAFMAPAYSNAALGISYKPNANYSFFFSPLTVRTTIVLDNSLASIGAYGMKNGNNYLIEPGAYFVARAKKNIWHNVDLETKLDMFTPYNSSFGNVDINWDVLINCKINTLLSATLSTTLRYYDRETTQVQFKEMFSLALAYKFAAKK